MLEANNTEQLPENAFVAYFNHRAILDNLEKITEHCTLLDLAHLEEALGTSRHQYVDTLYTLLNEHYFSNSVKTPEDSSKEHVQKTVTNILNTLRIKLNIQLSPYAFFEAAQGRVPSSHSKAETFWLQQIRYRYHLKINILTDSTTCFLSNIKTILLLQEPTFSRKSLEENVGQALYCAAYLEKNDIVCELLKREPISVKDKGQALQYAAQNENGRAIVQSLLNNTTPEPISAKDKGQALQYAAQNRYDSGIVYELLNNTMGEPISVKDKGQALQYAAQNENGRAIVQSLLSNTTPEPISAKDKGQALQYAAQNRYDSGIVYELLNNTMGEPISAKDKGQALQYAAQNENDREIFYYLLNNTMGEPISAKDKGKALQYAVQNKYDSGILYELLNNTTEEPISVKDKNQALQYTAQGESSNRNKFRRL